MQQMLLNINKLGLSMGRELEEIPPEKMEVIECHPGKLVILPRLILAVTEEGVHAYVWGTPPSPHGGAEPTPPQIPPGMPLARPGPQRAGWGKPELREGE